MPGTTIGTSLNYGYPGQVSRSGDEISRTFAVKKDTNNIKFGMPIVLNEDGTVQLFGSGHTADKFSGVAMRRVKSALVWPAQNFGEYRPEEAIDVLERGSIMVEVVKGTPKPGATVYIYNDGTTFGFSAEEDSGKTVKTDAVRWASGKDANNVAELTIVTRVGV